MKYIKEFVIARTDSKGLLEFWHGLDYHGDEWRNLENAVSFDSETAALDAALKEEISSFFMLPKFRLNRFED